MADGADPDTLLSQLRALRQPAQAVQQVTQAQIDEDRRWIAKLMLWTFCIASGVVLVAIPILAATDTAQWEPVSKSMLAVVAQVLLPVVTLVIGFYFRNEQR